MAVTIMTGASRLDSDDAAGQTVEQVRRNLGAALNIPANAAPVINGRAATETTALKDGDELVFAKATGVKG